MKNQIGFTLIEIMIVVAILGALLAYAIPTYIDYTTRSKATECMSLSHRPKLAVAEHWCATNNLSGIRNNNSVGLPQATNITGANVRKVRVRRGGKIKCFFTNKDRHLKRKYTLLTPKEEGSSLTWTCSTNLDARHAPSGCVGR